MNIIGLFLILAFGVMEGFLPESDINRKVRLCSFEGNRDPNSSHLQNGVFQKYKNVLFTTLLPRSNSCYFVVVVACTRSVGCIINSSLRQQGRLPAPREGVGERFLLRAHHKHLCTKIIKSSKKGMRGSCPPPQCRHPFLSAGSRFENKMDE